MRGKGWDSYRVSSRNWREFNLNGTLISRVQLLEINQKSKWGLITESSIKMFTFFYGLWLYTIIYNNSSTINSITLYKKKNPTQTLISKYGNNFIKSSYIYYLESRSSVLINDKKFVLLHTILQETELSSRWEQCL